MTTCPLCGGRGRVEVIIVSSPGRPRTRQVLFRCLRFTRCAWSSAGKQKPACPLQILQEEPADPVCDTEPAEVPTLGG